MKETKKQMNLTHFVNTCVFINDMDMDELRGKTFEELYPDGNTVIDSDLFYYFKINGYINTTTQEEREQFTNKVYRYIHK